VAGDAGHGIIAGIFEGKGLTGIEPVIQICVSLKASGPLNRKCTPVCKPGYECTERFGQSGMEVGNQSAALEIEILDVPSPGVMNRIVDFIQQNPLQCTAQRPCPSPPQGPDPSTGAPGQPLFVSFTAEQTDIGADTISTVADMDRLLTSLAGKPVTAGTPPTCPSTLRCADESRSPLFSANGVGTCLNNQPCLDAGHEYYLEKYAGGMVTLGNPWGGSNKDVTLAIKDFMTGFITISVNYLNPEQCSCIKN